MPGLNLDRQRTNEPLQYYGAVVAAYHQAGQKDQAIAELLTHETKSQEHKDETDKLILSR